MKIIKKKLKLKNFFNQRSLKIEEIWKSKKIEILRFSTFFLNFARAYSLKHFKLLFFSISINFEIWKAYISSASVMCKNCSIRFPKWMKWMWYGMQMTRCNRTNDRAVPPASYTKRVKSTMFWFLFNKRTLGWLSILAWSIYNVGKSYQKSLIFFSFLLSRFFVV